MSNITWCLAIDKESNRYFLKNANENFGSILYIVKEDSEEINKVNISELQEQGFMLVGECFEHENDILEELLSKFLKLSI